MKNFKNFLLHTLVALILCIALIFGSAITPIALSFSGDINADNIISAEDLVYVIQAILDGDDDLKYDINGDGSVNILDLANLKKKIAKFYSGKKFEAIAVTEIGNADAIKLSELFKACDGLTIDSSIVDVDVSTDIPYDDFAVNAEAWENTSINFHGTGTVTVTITEYCYSTSITFELVKEAKFKVKDSLNELYDNANNITAGDLFAELGYSIDNDKVNLTAETVSGTASAVINTEADSWKDYSIDLNGVGEIRISIEADSTPTSVVITVDDAVKFYANDFISENYGNASVITLGSLFYADYDKYQVNSSEISITTETLDGNVTATIEIDEENWENSKLEFDGTGSIKIAIAENSKTAFVTVKVVNADKFEVIVEDPHKILNTEKVVLGDIFAELTGVDVDSDKVIVTINKTQGNVEWSEFTVDADDWTKTVIEFKYEGQVDITIAEDSNSTTLTIIVEAVDKFATVNGVEIYEDETLKVGDIFTLIDGVSVNSDDVVVTVQNGTWTKDATDWKNGTIKFDTFGTYTITIKEDSKIATVTVTVLEKLPTDKFEIKLPNTAEYLYRVGNGNPVALGSLFKAIEGADVRNVTATITALDGTSVSGVFTANSDWTKATIQFSGTGIVEITITDDYYCNSLTLKLEVINAKNATSAMSATANNVVLLNDCGFSTISVENGYTLYGNGFNLTCSNDVTGDSMSSAFVTLNNGTLDNVNIICPNFSLAILYDSQAKVEGNVDAGAEWRYHNFRSAVTMNGISNIYNSYIYGGRAAVYLRSGYATISNTTIVGGAAANIHVSSAQNLTLRDITFIQEPTKATVNDTSKTLMGLSVIVVCGEDGSSTPITLEGKLIQYAWVNENYIDYVPQGTDSILSYVLQQSAYKHNTTINGQTAEWLNLGIAYMPADIGKSVGTPTINDNRTNKTNVPYEIVTISSLGTNGKVYSYKNTKGTDTEFLAKPSYAPNKQASIQPNISYGDTNANVILSNKYDEVKGWLSTLSVDLDAVGSYTFDFAKLIAEKYGKNLTYTVKTSSGTTVDISAPINLSNSGVYEYILNIVCDKIYDANGQLIPNEKETYSIPFTLVATKTSIAPPEKVADVSGTALLVVKSKDSDWSCALPALEGTQIKYWSVTENAYKTIALSSLVPSSTGKQNDTNNFWEYASNDFTLKITCGVIHEGKGVYGMPVVVNNGGNKLYFTISSTNGYVSSGTSARAVTVSYEFSDKNGGTITFSKTWNCNRQDMLNAGAKQYSYSDFVKGTLTEASGSSCVTQDTLITLADGTMKRINELTVSDKILAWDFFTGTYVERDLAFIVNHGTAEYDVVYTKYSDGTLLKIIAEHGVFDYDLNKFVYITAENVEQFIGHRFVKQNLNGGYDIVTMTEGYVVREYVEAWSISSAYSANAFASGLLTVGPPDDFYNWILMDGKLHYDVEQFEKDVETYGLYTYENFKDYITYEQFVTWNGAYLKIPIEKGYFTFDYILELIDLYKDGML